MDEGDKRKTLRESKIIGEEMLELIENVDGIQNISDRLKKKRKNIVTALNSLMDLNDLNIAKLEKNLEEVTSASVRGQEGLGATGVSSQCSGALSGSVANDTGHLVYLPKKCILIFIFKSHAAFQGDFGDSRPENRDSEGEGEGLGAAGASSVCSVALSGSVVNDLGHLVYLHTKKRHSNFHFQQPCCI